MAAVQRQLGAGGALIIVHAGNWVAGVCREAVGGLSCRVATGCAGTAPAELGSALQGPRICRWFAISRPYAAQVRLLPSMARHYRAPGSVGGLRYRGRTLRRYGSCRAWLGTTGARDCRWFSTSWSYAAQVRLLPGMARHYRGPGLSVVCDIAAVRCAGTAPAGHGSALQGPGIVGGLRYRGRTLRRYGPAEHGSALLGARWCCTGASAPAPPPRGAG